jgi:predicted SnoaL-like aldol condensation-catalyzing enzyme
MSTRSQQVVALLKALETGDQQAVGVINPAKYIQHNVGVADGLAGVLQLLKDLPKGATRVNTVRAFEDGDYVVAHTEYNFFGPKIGFDVFRFESGRIVEHWDNLQETAGPNLSGHTMIDGQTGVTDLHNTEVNRTLVRRFVDDILVNGRMETLAGYFDGDNYIQHNPHITDQLSGLSTALQEWTKQGITLKFDRVHKILAQGNFVLAISEGALGGRHTAFYDLFRVQNGKIAEHWDVLEAMVPKDQWKNPNGKFGFE